MIRLTIVVEGQTEEAFVKQILCPHLDAREVFTTAIIVETRRDPDGKKYRGGGIQWKKCRRELRSLLLDTGADLRVTTLFDLYQLPKDFPGVERHGSAANTAQRAALLEEAMATDIGDARFVPYLQRHEFEALVLAGLDHLEAALDPSQHGGLKALRKELGGQSPEDVNDGQATAPSKRLYRHIAGYDKLLHGSLTLESVGLSVLRVACPRFGRWLSTLESLAVP